MSFESLSLGCLHCPESLRRVLGRLFNYFFFLTCRTPCSVPGQGSGKTPLSEAQGCRLFVIVQFRPADAFLSPEPGGDQGTLFARNMVQGYVRVCVSFFFFYVLYLFYFVFFCLSTSSPSGAVGVATFHPGYLSFPCLTPRLADGPRGFFRITSPLC